MLNINQNQQQVNESKISVQNIPISKIQSQKVEPAYGNQQVIPYQNDNVQLGLQDPDNENYAINPQFQNVPMQVNNNIQQGIPVLNIKEIKDQREKEYRQQQRDMVNYPPVQEIQHQIIYNQNDVLMLRGVGQIDEVSVYIHRGFYQEQQHQVIFRSAVTHLPRIAQSIHEKSNFEVKGIKLYGSISFKQNTYDIVQDYIINVIKNQNEQLENEQIKKSKAVRCCYGLIKQIKQKFRWINIGSFMQALIQWVVLPIKIQTFVKMKDDKESGNLNIKWYIALSSLILFICSVNFIVIVISYFKCYFQLLKRVAAFYVVCFFLSFILFGIGMSINIEDNEIFFIINILSFIPNEFFSMILALKAIQVKIAITQLLVITKELPYSALQ